MSAPAFLRQLERELRRGLLPLWVLEELATAGPTYGYRLLARLSARAGPGVRIGPSTLYPALARLSARGLVESFHGVESRGPIRKYYRLTPAGRKALDLAGQLDVRYRADRSGLGPRAEGRARVRSAA